MLDLTYSKTPIKFKKMISEIAYTAEAQEGVAEFGMNFKDLIQEQTIAETKKEINKFVFGQIIEAMEEHTTNDHFIGFIWAEVKKYEDPIIITNTQLGVFLQHSQYLERFLNDEPRVTTTVADLQEMILNVNGITVTAFINPAWEWNDNRMLFGDRKDKFLKAFTYFEEHDGRHENRTALCTNYAFNEYKITGVSL